MASKRSTQFSSLPYEIYQHILSFGLDSEITQTKYLSTTEWYSTIRFAANFQSLNRKISEMPEMKSYFDKWWRKVWERSIGINKIYEKEFNEIIDELGKNGELKRKVLMAHYIKHKLWNHPKLDVLDEIKVVMVGKGGVGKSAITVYFHQRVFVEKYDPTIEDVYRKQLNIDGCTVFFNVLDTAGPEEYSAMRDQYMRTGECFILVCDLVDKQSLEEAQTLVEQLVRVKDMEVNDFPTIFALNKLDLLKEAERTQRIDEYTNEIHSIIKSNQLTNYEIISSSAKTGENIDHLYEECARRKRYGSYDNLALLRDIVKYDSEFIEISRKKLKKSMKQSKNCSLM